MRARHRNSPGPVIPSAEDVELARESCRRLTPFLEGNLRLEVAEQHIEVELPGIAVNLLVRALSELAEGRAVTLVPIDSELTTQQAADHLGVSRPFLVQLLERGELPFRKVGAHRRVQHRDVLAYRRRIDDARRKVLEELAAQGQELDLGY
jgi:excisionase family DNA binding protein